MGRSARSPIAGRRTVSGMDRMCSRISGASRSMAMICVTRARDLGLVPDFAGLKQRLPLHGLAEELDHPGRLGFPGRFGPAPVAPVRR